MTWVKCNTTHQCCHFFCCPILPSVCIQGLLHDLDKVQGEARAAAARADTADAEVAAREQLLAAARVRS